METLSQVRLHNSLTRRTEPLEPLEPGKVGIYTCGSTVYKYAHIGNLRTYLFGDLLHRTKESSEASAPPRRVEGATPVHRHAIREIRHQRRDLP